MSKKSAYVAKKIAEADLAAQLHDMRDFEKFMEEGRGADDEAAILHRSPLPGHEPQE